MLPEPTTLRKGLDHMENRKSTTLPQQEQGCGSVYSSLDDVCEFANIIYKCQDADAALLAVCLKSVADTARLRLSPPGKKTITMTRQAIADIFGWSLTKVDNTIPKLAATGFVSISKRRVKNKEQYFFEFDDDSRKPPINFEVFYALLDEIGSTKETLIISYVLYLLCNSKIIHNYVRWCAVTKQHLGAFLHVTERTVWTLLNNLKRKGILKTEKFLHNKQRCLHIALEEKGVQLCAGEHLKPLPNTVGEGKIIFLANTGINSD